MSVMAHSPMQEFGFQSSPRQPSAPLYHDYPYPSFAAATSPIKEPSSRHRPDLQIRVINPQHHKSIPSKLPLPATPTALLGNLYEALIMAKNCEMPKDQFWAKYDLSTNVAYTPMDIEHTLGTMGVECNTMQDGQHVTLGRWLLLKHGHFLLRAAHTITWVDVHGDEQQESTEGPSQLQWDWKSGAEKWRWHMWLDSRSFAT